MAALPGVRKRTDKGGLTGKPRTTINALFKDKSVEEQLHEMGCNPFEIVAAIAMGDVVRMGAMTQSELETPALRDGRGLIVQPSGRARSFEYIPMVLRAKAAGELLQYVRPKLLSQTVANPDGSKLDIVAVQLYLPDNGRV